LEEFWNYRGLNSNPLFWPGAVSHLASEVLPQSQAEGSFILIVNETSKIIVDFLSPFFPFAS
jgi:hypothetical protein